MDQKVHVVGRFDAPWRAPVAEAKAYAGKLVIRLDDDLDDALWAEIHVSKEQVLELLQDMYTDVEQAEAWMAAADHIVEATAAIQETYEVTEDDLVDDDIPF